MLKLTVSGVVIDSIFRKKINIFENKVQPHIDQGTTSLSNFAL